VLSAASSSSCAPDLHDAERGLQTLHQTLPTVVLSLLVAVCSFGQPLVVSLLGTSSVIFRCAAGM
jgi:branched-subunit amino acid transport protein AzlD